MNIQTVLFDLDNTLYDYDAAHACAYRALYDCFRREDDVTQEAFDTLYREAMEEQIRRARGACSSIHNRLIRFQVIVENQKLPLSLAHRMSAAYWTAFLAAVRPVPGVRETLETLKAEGYTVGVGTNMTADYQYEKLLRLGLLDVPDFLVTSEEINVEKPDPEFFALCAKKAGCPVEACVFVGDSWRYDMEGARASGMVGVWLSPKAAEYGVPGVASLTELPALLRTLTGGRDGKT